MSRSQSRPSPHFSQRAFCNLVQSSALRVGPNRGKTPKSCPFKNEGIPEVHNSQHAILVYIDSHHTPGFGYFRPSH